MSLQFDYFYIENSILYAGATLGAKAIRTNWATRNKVPGAGAEQQRCEFMFWGLFTDLSEFYSI